MSYCRRAEDSDVYIYQTPAGFFCAHDEKDDVHILRSHTALIDWMRAAEERGLKVPASAFDRVRAEMTNVRHLATFYKNKVNGRFNRARYLWNESRIKRRHSKRCVTRNR